MGVLQYRPPNENKEKVLNLMVTLKVLKIGKKPTNSLMETTRVLERSWILTFLKQRHKLYPLLQGQAKD